MNDARLRRVLERLTANAASLQAAVADVLCATTVEMVEVDGAGLSLHSTDGPLISVAVAGPDMAVIHELERTLGEGPCIDAFQTRRPTAAPDLAAGTVDRWPAFRAEALRTGARAAFGYPLRIADVCVGALNLYSTRTGPLAADKHEDALVLADLSTRAVLARLTGEPADASVAELDGIMGVQDEVHQATGMISVQLGIPIIDALARLRARAFADGRPLSDVAADVVHRRLRFES